MISPFQFIINNNTQVTTWRNPINNLIINAQQSFISFITGESHITGFLNIYTQFISHWWVTNVLSFFAVFFIFPVLAATHFFSVNHYFRTYTR